ncbi:MAG: hypothetical protein WCY59_08785 [Anaerovoracaceae bacterium]
MPNTWQDALYVLMSGVIMLGVPVIGWLVNRGFGVMEKKLADLDGSVSGLRQDLAKEREDRITLYGELSARIAAHRAICDERHREK